jgi:glutathione S-transferase
MLKLFHHPRTRSSRFIFLLEELGAPYEIHRIANLRRPTVPAVWIRKIPIPMAMSPALKDGDALVWESSAIALYSPTNLPRTASVLWWATQARRLCQLARLLRRRHGAGLDERYMKWEIPRGTAGWVKTDEVMTFVNANLKRVPIYWATHSAPPTS